MNEEIELVVSEVINRMSNMDTFEIRDKNEKSIGNGFMVVRMLPVNNKHLEKIKVVDDDTINITYHKSTVEKLENRELARIEGDEYSVTLKPFRD